MEESEQRRERLRAMRVEAASQAGVDTNIYSSVSESSGLSNPLIESERACPSPSQYTSRFDYYTDPMAAFSGSRRRNDTIPQVSQGHSNMPPRPMYHGMNPSPFYHNPGVGLPGPMYHGMNPSPFYHNPGVGLPGQTIFQLSGAHFNQSPLQSQVQLVIPSGISQGNPPNAWGGSGSALNYSKPPPNFSNPGFRQGKSPHVNYGRGRGHRFNSSPQYDAGRGRGRAVGRSGAGSHEPVSAEQRPDLFYRKEMVEDPWKMLTPIIWKNLNARDSDKSWLPESISAKKAKVSGEHPQTSISQQSLAEYLAASFDNSIDEAVDGEQTT